ncbi:MAG: helicase-associated domain-containing protein [Spirochaetaceae bacterium]|nr:helicase-associated domain-containing protein [Spirochaetaceae bacterium]MDE0219682.1 helicase-associated domain-containing protein [Spirochaetaceae bacterium]
MKLLDVDWHEIFDLLPKWESLTIEQRRFLIDRIPAKYWTRTRDEELIALGWLEPVRRKKAIRHEVPQSRRFWLILFRELSRAGPFPDEAATGDAAAVLVLKDYLLQHYTGDEVSRLGRRRSHSTRYQLASEMSGAGWWRQFLDWHGEPDSSARGDDRTADHDKPDQRDERLRSLLDTPVAALDLSVRSEHCLRNLGISTIGELTRKDDEEIARARNLGRQSLAEIKSRLEEQGLHLGMTEADYSAARRLPAVAEPAGAIRPRRAALGADGRWQQAPPAAVSTAKELIDAVVAHGGPIAVSDLFEAAGERSHRDTLAAGLEFAFREALLLIVADAALLPFVCIWPPILHRLRRGRAASPRESTFRSVELLCRPLLVEDIATLLLDAIAEPPRLKSGTYHLFARNLRAVGASLSAVPAWIAPEFAPLNPDRRVARAAHFALSLRLATAQEGAGTNRKLVVTDQGRRWLTRPAKERLKEILDLLREDAMLRPEESHEFLDPWYAEDPEAVPLNFVPHVHGMSWFVGSPERGVVDAFRAVGRESILDLQAFVRFHAEERNPLLERTHVMGYEQAMDSEGSVIAERVWGSTLLAFVHERLIPLGGIALGPVTEGDAGFRMTDIGRYLLGEADDFDLDASADTGDVIVQPNFEIVFLSPSPTDQVRARVFAAPTAAMKGPDAVGTLFVINRASIQRAVTAGQDAEQVIAAAGDLSKQPLPANVSRQIRDWAAEVRWIEVRPAVVVDCGDAETAAHVLAAAGKRGRPLSESVVELVEGADLTPAIRRKLISRGIFMRS